MANPRPLTFLLLGGSPSSTNRGVAALGLASIAGLRKAFPEAEIITGCSGVTERVDVPLGRETVNLETTWLHPSNLWKRRSGTRHLRAVHALSRWLPARLRRVIGNRTLEQLHRADVVLDLSAGDSFADIYGPAAFRHQAAIKEFVLSMGKPLVLLPQTYGPFTQAESAAAARRIIERSLLAATRDAGGLADLANLTNHALNGRAVQCPDVAFGLEPVPVALADEPSFAARSSGETVIGLNVSGLLYGAGQGRRLGLRVDYPELIAAIVKWALATPRTRVLLVPHVYGPHAPAAQADGEACRDASDAIACEMLLAQLGARYGGRIDRLRGVYGAGQLKFIIGKCDFFVGARMHACIAAVSQGVPTVTLAYSKKAEGVMGVAGAGNTVIDLRAADLAGCLDHLRNLYERRGELRKALTARMPDLQQNLEEFFTRRLAAALGSVGGTERRSDQRCATAL